MGSADSGLVGPVCRSWHNSRETPDPQEQVWVWSQAGDTPRSARHSPKAKLAKIQMCACRRPSQQITPELCDVHVLLGPHSVSWAGTEGSMECA